MYIHPGRFPPDLFAGTEMAMHSLCRALLAGGHEVWVVAVRDTVPDGEAYGDHECGYPAVRSKSLVETARIAAEQFRPDVFVASHAGDWMADLGPVVGDVPLVVYEHEVSKSLEQAPEALRAHAAFVANSEVTAAYLLRRHAVASTVVRPLFGIDQYASIKRHGDKVLFVSLQPRKGADVAIRIARARPSAQFVFVESWTRNIEATMQLREQVAEIANVTLLANQSGLAAVLPHVKLLLMPSRGQESWGRTATEAQLCGIPVLGSSRGNLTRTIGPGGVTLDPNEPIERWLEAFDAIMDDPARYRDLSHKALEHGALLTQQIGREYQIFERVLADAVAGRAA
jgi:glycosyltransferase involved in cell wall biosynthesis